jgi:predicted phage baseplate assembly protein
VKLPQIDLDDRRFQDLVSEARTRIIRKSPGWTEHNVSDPGVTLIELFAWMTEMTIYRINRIPEKVHIALLQLLGIPLDGPTAATTTLRFRLSESPSDPLVIPGATEVGTERTSTEEAVVFQVDEDFTISPIRPAAYLVKHEAASRPTNVGVGSDGVATPQDLDRHPFGSPSTAGDALYLGFEEPLDALLVEVVVEAKKAGGPGVQPDDPILRWEVSDLSGGWSPAEVLGDTTGGFNFGAGVVELELPQRSGVQSIGAQRLHWLRCRVDALTVSGQKGLRYERSPEIFTITVRPIGARVAATHASRVESEILGVSDGTPSQVFPLRHHPVLKPDSARGETLEVRLPPKTQRDGDAATNGNGRDWLPWQIRSDFASSSDTDPHFVLDAATGEIEFGPVVRQKPKWPEREQWKQYGKIPEEGSQLRFTRYRHGGGNAGNVNASELTVLKSTLPGVDTVVNPDPAVGGVDPETVNQARQRAAMEIRSRYRAVTADDFEFLAGEASARVGRVVCLEPAAPGGPVRVHIVPKVPNAARFLRHDELMPDEVLLNEVSKYLDDRRLIGMRVELAACDYKPLLVVAEIEALPMADTVRIQRDVELALYTFLNPLLGGNPAGPGPGWPFGRPVNVGELYGVLHAVEGVSYVRMLRTYEYDLASNEPNAHQTERHIPLEPSQVAASGKHIIQVSHSQS